MIKKLHSNNDLPPYNYLLQVLEHCPKAGALYIHLWKDKDKKNIIKINKKTVREEYLSSLSKFRHDVLMLVKEGLASVDESPNQMIIELTGWDIDAEGFTLC